MAQWERLEIRDGMLYRRWELDGGKSSKLQLIVPTNKRQDVLKLCHDIPTSGHIGVEQTLARNKDNFYWSKEKKRTKESVQEFCRRCDRCFAGKPKNERVVAPLAQYIVGEPMERVALDILGPLPITKQKNRNIGDHGHVHKMDRSCTNPFTGWHCLCQRTH